MLNPSEEKASSRVHSQPRIKQVDSLFYMAWHYHCQFSTHYWPPSLSSGIMLAANENDKGELPLSPAFSFPRNLLIAQKN
jgi:hypothetical protein